jgi:hypothetical protein
MSLSNKGPFNPEKQNIAMSKCRKSATKKGNEKINGIDCIIYEYKCLMNNEEFNIIEWRNKDGFPIKTISKYKDTVTTVEIVDLKINVSLSDSLFKPDSDIKFMDMEKVMGEKMKINTKDDIDKSSKEYGGNESETNDEDVDAGEMMKNMMKKYINK